MMTHKNANRAAPAGKTGFAKTVFWLIFTGTAGQAGADPLATRFERPAVPFATAGPEISANAGVDILNLIPTGADDMRGLGVLSGFGFSDYGSSHWQSDGSRTPDRWLVTENAQLRPWRNLLSPNIGLNAVNFGVQQTAMDFSSHALFSAQSDEIARMTDPAAPFWSAPGYGAALQAAGPGAPVHYAGEQMTGGQAGNVIAPVGRPAAPDGEDIYAPAAESSALDMLNYYFDVRTAGDKQRIISYGDSNTAILVGANRRVELVNMATGDSITVTGEGARKPANDRDPANPNGDALPRSFDLPDGPTFPDFLKSIFFNPFFIFVAVACAIVVLALQAFDYSQGRAMTAREPDPAPQIRKHKRRRRPLDAPALPPIPAEFADNADPAPPLPAIRRKKRKRRWQPYEN